MDRVRSLSYEGEETTVSEWGSTLWRTSRFEPTPEDLASGWDVEESESEEDSEEEDWEEERRPTCCDCYMDCKTAEWLHEETCRSETPVPAESTPEDRKAEFIANGYAYRDRVTEAPPQSLERARKMCDLLLFCCDYTDVILEYPQLIAVTVTRAKELLDSEWAEELPTYDILCVRALVNVLTAETAI
jgi:hypothetical protein